MEWNFDTMEEHLRVWSEFADTMEEKIVKIKEICIDYAKEGQHEGYWCGESNAMDAFWNIMEILGALDEWPEDDEK
jgi:hypothetical protein